MKKSTIITIVAFTLGVLILAVGFILLTDNNISKVLRAKKVTTTTAPEITTTTTTTRPKYDPMNLFQENITDYVTLGDYKGLTIEVDQLEVSAEEIEFYIQQMLVIDGEYTKVREGVIAEKNIFNFDYTGYYLKEDGTKDKTLENGSGTNQLAYIDGDVFYILSSSGVSTFIDGFAQGVLGKTVGETFDIDITFPSNYGDSKLAGKKVVFTIKLNHIASGDFSDGWVKEYSNGQYETCDAYREYVKNTVEENLKANAITLLWTKIIDNAVVVEIPEQEYNYWYYYFVEQVEYYQMMYQMYGYNYTYEDMLKICGFEDEKALADYAKKIVIQELITFAVIQAEGIEATDEEYRIMLDSLIEQTGKTEAEVLEMYSESKIREQIILNKVDGIIYDLNTFVVKAE